MNDFQPSRRGLWHTVFYNLGILAKIGDHRALSLANLIVKNARENFGVFDRTYPMDGWNQGEVTDAVNRINRLIELQLAVQIYLNI